MEKLMVLFWLSTLCILTCWLFYPVFLFFLARRHDRTVDDEPDRGEKNRPMISFIVAAHNEQDTIVRRIHNLVEVSGSYPFEIIIGSDGSTDKTVSMAGSLNLACVVVADFKTNRGRALVHNDCCQMATGDILVFTDAETVFAPDFLNRVIPWFQDPAVGAVAGRILYANQDSTDIGRSAGLYWKYEEAIRIWESRIGILGFGTGAALAIRKKAYAALRPDEDIDYAGTLLAAEKGYKIRYQPAAKAFDYISETSSGALKTRIRQTSRCFKSVLRIIFSIKFIKNRPGVFFAAIFHKTFRHLTPFFMVVSFVTNLSVLQTHFIYQMIGLTQVMFYLCALTGMILPDHYEGKFRWLFRLPYTFVLYNVGRGIGVLKTLSSGTRSVYTTRR